MATLEKIVAKLLISVLLCMATAVNADSRYANGSYVGDLITLGVRDLSPRLSRFLETDPARQLFSAYSYAAGTPVTVADPTGAVLGSEL
ncbi:RHS repeat-associated core domain-containing protein, partial [Thiolapillus sp.]|uniref:RHS repeat-associated core domain-containing protein n=5 Tax=Thiolapillus sp. TaxID=2017437 RepID=UPI003AF72943